MKYKLIFIYSVGFGTIKVPHTIVAYSHLALFTMNSSSSFSVASHSNEMPVGTATGYPLPSIKHELSQYLIFIGEISTILGLLYLNIGTDGMHC